MQAGETMRRGTVLEPVVASRFGRRLCVLLSDATAPQVHLCIAEQDAGGNVRLTGVEFLLPPSALEALRPVEGMSVDV